MSDRELPPHLRERRSPRLAGFDYRTPGLVYMVTVRARAGLAPFTDPQLANEVVNALLHQRQSGHLQIYAYALMPDHLHMAVSVPCEERSPVDVLRDFKAFTTRLAWRHGLQGELWQRSYHDHIARRADDLRSICDYILANPVRKGLAHDCHPWPFTGTPDPLPI
ncbi:MAG: REP-associated tyrosine transposase [Chloroflexota bacterium]